MKLRKNEIISLKIFLTPREEIKKNHGGVLKFLGGNGRWGATSDRGR